jgi:hypothetical protein
VNLPAHIALSIEHNDHKTVYAAVADHYDPVDFVSDEEYRKCVEMDEAWLIRWFPETPVGHCVVIASTLEEALKAVENE